MQHAIVDTGAQEGKRKTKDMGLFSEDLPRLSAPLTPDLGQNAAIGNGVTVIRLT